MSAALVAAAAEAGIRLTLLDVCYLSGGLTADRPPAARPGAAAVQRRLRGGLGRAGRHLRRRPRRLDRRRVGAVHSVRAVPEPTTWPGSPSCRRRGRAAARPPQRADRPRTPRRRRSTAAPRPSCWTATACWARPHQRRARDPPDRPATSPGSGSPATVRLLLPDHRTRPGRRDRPGDALADAGSPLTLGTDQHAVIDMFEEIRGLEMHERLISNERGRFTPTELIAAATADGHAQPGRADAGRHRGRAHWPTSSRSTRHSVRTAGSRPDQIDLRRHRRPTSDRRRRRRSRRPRRHRTGSVPIGALLREHP